MPTTYRVYYDDDDFRARKQAGTSNRVIIYAKYQRDSDKARDEVIRSALDRAQSSVPIGPAAIIRVTVTSRLRDETVLTLRWRTKTRRKLPDGHSTGIRGGYWYDDDGAYTALAGPQLGGMGA